MAGIAQDSWSVGATYPWCDQRTHFDVSVRLTVTSCDFHTVNLRVYDLGHESNGSGSRSRLWWSQVGSSRHLFIEKSVSVPTLGETVVVDFAVQGDNVRWQGTALEEGSYSQGTITACCNTENDGIHVNPCYFGGGTNSNRVARIAYRYNNTGAWTWGGYIMASPPN